MAEKNNANIGFEKQIWDAACELWGHIPTADANAGVGFIRISILFHSNENFQKNVPKGIESS